MKVWNMKNKIIVFLSLAMLCSLLFGCVEKNDANGDTKSDSSSQSADTLPSTAETTESTEHENKYFSVEKVGDTYTYILYNKNKSVAETIEGCTEEPFIFVTDSELIRITLGRETYYYDLENCVFSEIFTDVFDENGTLMVRGENSSLIICDIFDENGFYKALEEFSYTLSSNGENPFISCEFIDGGGSVSCVYSTADGERLECFNITNGTKYVTVSDWKNKKELIGGDEKSTVESFLFSYMGTVDYNTGLKYAYDITGKLEINGEWYYYCECFYLMEKNGEEERVHAARFVLSENYTFRYDCRENDDGELVVYTENNMM